MTAALQAHHLRPALSGAASNSPSPSNARLGPSSTPLKRAMEDMPPADQPTKPADQPANLYESPGTEGGKPPEPREEGMTTTTATAEAGAEVVVHDGQTNGVCEEAEAEAPPTEPDELELEDLMGQDEEEVVPAGRPEAPTADVGEASAPMSNEAGSSAPAEGNGGLEAPASTEEGADNTHADTHAATTSPSEPAAVSDEPASAPAVQPQHEPTPAAPAPAPVIKAEVSGVKPATANDQGEGATATAAGGSDDAAATGVPTTKVEKVVKKEEPTAMEVDAQQPSGDPESSSAAEAGGLPPPTGQPTVTPAPCLRGRIIPYPDGRHVFKGQWAMNKADHEKGGLTSKFEFSTTPPDAGARAPANGTYVGFFFMATKADQVSKYDDQCTLEFVPNSAGGWNIEGNGHNKFGTYGVCGTVSSSPKYGLQLELFRLFDHLVNPQLKGKNRRHSASAASAATRTRGGGAAPPPQPPQAQAQTQMRPPATTRQSLTATAGDTASRPPPIQTLQAPSASSVASEALTPVSHLTEASALVGIDGPASPANTAPVASAPAVAPEVAHPPPHQPAPTAAAPAGPPGGRIRKAPSKIMDDEDRRPQRYMHKCLEILVRMQRMHNARFFNQPVDPVRDVCPDYYAVIKQPMDLATLKSHVESGHVHNPDDFATQMRLIFSNALLYNARPEHIVHVAALELRTHFEEKFAQAFPPGSYDASSFSPDGASGPLTPMKLERDASRKRKRNSALDSSFDYDMSFLDDGSGPPPTFGNYEFESAGGGGSRPPSLAKKRSSSYGGAGARRQRPASHIPHPHSLAHQPSYDQQALLKRIEALEKQVKASERAPAAPAVDESKPLTYDEKKNLRTSIENLPADKAHRVVKIIQDNMQDLGQLGEDEEVEIDIDKLDTATLRQLQRYVAQCMGGGGPSLKRQSFQTQPKPGPRKKRISRWNDDSDYESGSDLDYA